MKKWQNDWNVKKIIVRHQTFGAFPLSKVFTTFSWRGFVCLKFLWWQTILFNVVYSWSFNSKFKNFILTKLDNFKFISKAISLKLNSSNNFLKFVLWVLRNRLKFSQKTYCPKLFKDSFYFLNFSLKKKIRPSFSFGCSII